MNGKFLPENETVEFEDRLYLNPNTSLQEQTDFISNLRNTQNANNAEINAQTYNLGTAVPSNLGGLVGGEGYFTSRYQTPQNVSVAANLRAAAQAQALNEVLGNELATQKKRYNDAYRAAQRRANTPTPGNPENPADDGPDNVRQDMTTIEVGDIVTEGLSKSRYQKLFMKYIKAGYPAKEAEARAKEDFGKSIDVDAAVEPYNGGK